MKGADGPCFAAGMDGYLTKPIHRETLEATLRRFIGKHFSSHGDTLAAVQPAATGEG